MQTHVALFQIVSCEDLMTLFFLFDTKLNIFRC